MKQSKQKPAQVKQVNKDLENLLHSSGWKLMLAHIRANHPVGKGLGPAATMEQRAMHQIKCENYESIVAWMESFSVENTLKELPSEYLPDTKQ